MDYYFEGFPPVCWWLIELKGCECVHKLVLFFWFCAKSQLQSSFGPKFCDFSPTAIALGSSAIVKVSGQNRSSPLYGSLGQIRVGLPKGSAEGSTKEGEGSTKEGQGSTKVSPRFHQGSAKVLQVSRCLWSSGVDLF